MLVFFFWVKIWVAYSFFYAFQWLVKKAMETREEMGDYIRQYSISQFNKHYSMPQVS